MPMPACHMQPSYRGTARDVCMCLSPHLPALGYGQTRDYEGTRIHVCTPIAAGRTTWGSVGRRLSIDHSRIEGEAHACRAKGACPPSAMLTASPCQQPIMLPCSAIEEAPPPSLAARAGCTRGLRPFCVINTEDFAFLDTGNGNRQYVQGAAGIAGAATGATAGAGSLTGSSNASGTADAGQAQGEVFGTLTPSSANDSSTSMGVSNTGTGMTGTLSAGTSSQGIQAPQGDTCAGIGGDAYRRVGMNKCVFMTVRGRGARSTLFPSSSCRP